MCPVHSHVITVDQVKFAINKLKSGKSDCIDDLLSNNLNTIVIQIYCILFLNKKKENNCCTSKDIGR